jgi:DNA-binding transcriptional regulator YiaG
MNFARIIREAREKLKLNQPQLAELIGISSQAVQQWESGRTQAKLLAPDGLSEPDARMEASPSNIRSFYA